MTQGILYISYDGMLEPLGQSQVLAYLEKLAAGRRIHLLSFEKPTDWSDFEKRRPMQERIAAAGIRWHPLRYHKNPTAPATAYDVISGIGRAIPIILRHRLSIVHARSYVAALIALAAKRATGAKFLFDMRGLWADERVDGGLWPRGGSLYRTAKSFEARFLRAGDHVVTLTRASESEIRRFAYLAGRVPPITVIPTCADLDRFTIQGPPQREPFVLGYVGSLGTWYLLDDMLRFFRELRNEQPNARLLMVNRNEHSLIGERMDQLGIDPANVEIAAADHNEMPKFVARMSAGMALYQQSFSRVACSPTKLAEYLGSGVPCLGTNWVGDLGEILSDRGVGVALADLSDATLRDAAGDLLELTAEGGLQQRCRSVAEDMFSLETGVAAYDSIYNELALGSSR